MDKLGDFRLFVKIVQHNGLALAGRELGMSPASVTARLNRLESGYGVRLLNRTTRRVALTDEGRAFYASCLQIIRDVDEAEERLVIGKTDLSGAIKVSATFDLGRQQIAPMVAEFSHQYPKVSIQLHFADHLVDLIAGEYDLGIRYGTLNDSGFVARKLARNHRILCASPEYIIKHGNPSRPDELAGHRCMTLIREQQAHTYWHFSNSYEQASVQIHPTLQSNDGGQLRLWALEGLGIALKSYWDIKSDLVAGRLVPILQDYRQNWGALNDDGQSDIYAVYPGRSYLPERTKVFIDQLSRHFSAQIG